MLKDFRDQYWTPRFLTLVGITLAAATSRLLPHPPNFTPLGAIALFSGAYFSSTRAAFAVPLLAMVISNAILGITRYGTSIFPLLPYVYASFALTVCIGLFLRRRHSPFLIGSAAFGSALLFFLITNFGVWVKGRQYPLTMEGFALCYVAALPYFRNMLLGDLVYSTVLFGSFELAVRYLPWLRDHGSYRRLNIPNL
jgi:hypothetical protein